MIRLCCCITLNHSFGSRRDKNSNTLQWPHMTCIVLYLNGDVFGAWIPFPQRLKILKWICQQKQIVPPACGIQACISRRRAVTLPCPGREEGPDWIAAPVLSSRGRRQEPSCIRLVQPSAFQGALTATDHSSSKRRIQRRFTSRAFRFRHRSSLGAAWSTGRLWVDEAKQDYVNQVHIAIFHCEDR